MKILRNHFTIVLLTLSLGALALLAGCASPVPVDLYTAEGAIRPAPTATAHVPTTVPETPAVVDTATAMPTATEIVAATPTVEDTATATATATAENTATPTATATAEDTATATPTATATAEDTPTATATATVGSTATRQVKATAIASPTPPKLSAAATVATATAVPTRRATATPQRPTRTPTRTPTPDPRFNAVIREAELNKSVQDAIAQDPSLNVSNVNIDLQPGQIVASGRAVLGFFPVNLQIVATVDVINGKAVPEITEIYVNGSPAAGFIRQQVINLLSPYLAQMTDLGDDLFVEKVEITNSEMAISGRRK